MVEKTAVVPLVVEQELVAHLFFPGDGPLAEDAHRQLEQLWRRCGDLLAVTEPIVLPGDPHPGVADMRQDGDHNIQVVVRRVHDVRNLSLALASRIDPSGQGSQWQQLDRLLDAVLADDTDTAIGVQRLYLAKASTGMLRDPAGLGPRIIPILPEVARGGGWRRSLTTDTGLLAWEFSAREDARAERRLVVLAPPHGDRELSEWAWSDGWPPMPPLARYLMHTAKIRYQLRVHSGAVPPAECLCHALDEGVGHVRALLDGGLGDLDGRMAALRVERVRAAERIAGLEAIRRTVQIARMNAADALEGHTDGAGLFDDDMKLAAWFDQLLDDEISYLRSSAEAAMRVSKIVQEARPRRASASDLSALPTFAIVTALPEEFAAVCLLLDDRSGKKSVPNDRGNYIFGTMPGLDPASPHRIVLTLLGDTGNDAAANACAHLARSFASVAQVLMVGIAAGVPDPGRPERHVRLGDIVVSTWGIVDYDHVTDKPDEPVLRQPFPRPSRLLAEQANWLASEEFRGNRPWEEWLARGESELPDFARPPAETDLLYLSDAAEHCSAHPDPSESGHRPNVPKVHYGFIGSADRALRNAATRDEQAAKHNLRAFEMEGKGVGNAGFASGLEWIVIRGVSDYGDSRTSTRWRNYASLAAAAYARALLAVCPPVAPRGGHTTGPRP